MQVKKDTYIKLLDEVKALDKQARTLSANDSATVADYAKLVSAAFKVLRKVRNLEKK